MKTSLVLSGGGVKGSFQMGVLLGLKSRGLLDQVSTVYGTSVGAINAALVALAPSNMEKLWTDVKGRRDILSFNWKTLLLRSDGIYNLGPMHEKLVKYCVEDSKIEAVACYADLQTGEVLYASSKDLPRDEFLKCVVASSAIPFIMSPVDDRYVDGGVREQSPLSKAIEDGADRIIVVLCNPWVVNPTDRWTMPKGFLKFLSAGYRGLDLLEHEVFRTDLLVCDQKNEDPGYRKIDISLYAPDRVWMDTLEFLPAKISAALEAGKAASLAGPMPL